MLYFKPDSHKFKQEKAANQTGYRQLSSAQEQQLHWGETCYFWCYWYQTTPSTSSPTYLLGCKTKIGLYKKNYLKHWPEIIWQWLKHFFIITIAVNAKYSADISQHWNLVVVHSSIHFLSEIKAQKKRDDEGHNSPSTPTQGARAPATRV